MRKKRRKKRKKMGFLQRSPINYFSDLFIMAMVVAWILVLVIMAIVAVYATLRLGDTSMWNDVGTLVAVPLSAGGAIWMIKCGVQHAIANQQGKTARMDFPAVNADGENDGLEKQMFEEMDE